MPRKSAKSAKRTHVSDSDSDDWDIPEMGDDEVFHPTGYESSFQPPYTLKIVTVGALKKDLPSIAPSTLANVMSGKGKKKLPLVIVDCRYPYEFEAGHVAGAINLFTHDQIVDHFIAGKKALQGPVKNPKIIIFYCEFSSERAPQLMRHLRACDRQVNSVSDGALYYPEIYLVDRGYSHIYAYVSELGPKTLLKPNGYALMADPAFSEELDHWRRVKAEGETTRPQPRGRF